MTSPSAPAGAPPPSAAPVNQPRRSLARHLSELQLVLDQAPSFLALTQGPAHVVSIANEAYLRLVGRRREDVVGKPIVQAIPELKEQGLGLLLDEVLQSEQQRTGAAVKVRLAGSLEDSLVERRIDFILQPIFDVTNRTVGIIIQGLDVTDRELAIQALRAADRNKDIFLATLAHEMLSPLSASMTALELLEKLMGMRSPDVDRIMRILDRQLPAVAALVEDLLDVSRIKLGKVVLSIEDVAIQDAVTAAAEMCQDRIDAVGHRLRIDAPEAPVVVRADRRRLIQVVTNLLVNSAKFTAPGGNISVKVRQRSDFGEVVISDDGQGMTAEQTQHAFDLFHQNSALDSMRGGLGIGLALVRQLLELQGGSVQAESAGVSFGSAFTIRLALAPR